jgi:hypothetical protein
MLTLSRAVSPECGHNTRRVFDIADNGNPVDILEFEFRDWTGRHLIRADRPVDSPVRVCALLRQMPPRAISCDAAGFRVAAVKTRRSAF